MGHVDQDDETPTTPSGTTTVTGGGRRRVWLVVAVVAVVAVAIGGALALTGGDDDDVTTSDTADDDPVADGTAGTGAPTTAEPGEATGTGGPDAGGDGPAATVAVIYGNAGLDGEPADLTFAFVAPDGSTVAERSWSEVEIGIANEGAEMQGLVQGVPAGEVTLRATLGDATCEQAFTVAEGDRTILRAQPAALGVETDPMDAPIGAGGASSGAVGEPVDPEACAVVETVDQWVDGRTGPTGEAYVGMSLADAEAQATEAGLETRVLGVDGMDLAATMDFREDRLNLMTFDGVVVAAALDGEGGG
jgi:hypothetical protein